MSKDGGKGDAPRKGADQKKYDEGYERIFGKKKKPPKNDQKVKEDDDKSAW